MVIGWLHPLLPFVESAGEGVVTEFHRPGEVIVELDAIHLAALHDLPDQPEKALAHAGVSGIQPHHLLAVHQHSSAAIAFLQHPLRVLPHHGGIGGLHQAVLKPGDHLQAALVGGAGHVADGVVSAIGLQQGRLDRRPAAAVKGGAPAPHIGVERVEAGARQFGDGAIEAPRLVVERAGAVGEPHPNAALFSPGGNREQGWKGE